MLAGLKPKDTQILQQNKILLGGQTISLRARQMVYVLAALMDKNNPTEKITIPAKDFLDFINRSSKDKWTDIYSASNEIFKNLNDNPILIKEPGRKNFTKINWLSSLGVKQGVIVGRFSADIAEFFLYRQGLPYTKLLWDLTQYRSSFTARIMDLFQRFHRHQSDDSEFTFEYDYEELRLFFGVHHKYNRPSDFKKRVLETARKELENNDTVPYWFTYSEIRRGKSLQRLVFTVYIRSEVLIERIPALQALRTGNKNQTDIFDAQRENTFSDTKKKVFGRLVDEFSIPKSFAQSVLANFNNSQSVAYFRLIEYGVNRQLAHTIIEDYCSFGELEGREFQYVEHTLAKIEKARLKRIEEHKAGKSKKRITPLEKRGGLPKKVFAEKQHFASFMEKISSLHNNRTKKESRSGFHALSDVLESAGYRSSLEENE